MFYFGPPKIGVFVHVFPQSSVSYTEGTCGDASIDVFLTVVYYSQFHKLHDRILDDLRVDSQILLIAQEVTNGIGQPTQA